MSNYGQVYATASISKASRRKQYVEERPMKKTFKQRFKDWLFDDSANIASGIQVDEESIQLTRENSIRFEIHQASGGRVVQTRRYDPRKDRNLEGLYIITSDKDFGHEIDKIITMESLKA
jgi:hypothetical protein